MFVVVTIILLFFNVFLPFIACSHALTKVASLKQIHLCFVQYIVIYSYLNKFLYKNFLLLWGLLFIDFNKD